MKTAFSFLSGIVFLLPLFAGCNGSSVQVIAVRDFEPGTTASLNVSRFKVWNFVIGNEWKCHTEAQSAVISNLKAKGYGAEKLSDYTFIKLLAGKDFEAFRMSLGDPAMLKQALIDLAAQLNPNEALIAVPSSWASETTTTERQVTRDEKRGTITDANGRTLLEVYRPYTETRVYHVTNYEVLAGAIVVLPGSRIVYERQARSTSSGFHAAVDAALEGIPRRVAPPARIKDGKRHFDEAGFACASPQGWTVREDSVKNQESVHFQSPKGPSFAIHVDVYTGTTRTPVDGQLMFNDVSRMAAGYLKAYGVDSEWKANSKTLEILKDPEKSVIETPKYVERGSVYSISVSVRPPNSLREIYGGFTKIPNYRRLFQFSVPDETLMATIPGVHEHVFLRWREGTRFGKRFYALTYFSPPGDRDAYAEVFRQFVEGFEPVAAEK